jgi:hypothetical protein
VCVCFRLCFSVLAIMCLSISSVGPDIMILVPATAQRGTSLSLARSHQVTRLQCFSRGSQQEKMDVKGSLDLTICMRELSQDLGVDRHRLDPILEMVEKSL